MTEDPQRAPDRRAERILQAVASADLRPLVKAFLAAALEARANDLDNRFPSRPPAHPSHSQGARRCDA